MPGVTKIRAENRSFQPNRGRQMARVNRPGQGNDPPRTQRSQTVTITTDSRASCGQHHPRQETQVLAWAALVVSNARRHGRRFIPTSRGVSPQSSFVLVVKQMDQTGPWPQPHHPAAIPALVPRRSRRENPMSSRPGICGQSALFQNTSAMSRRFGSTPVAMRPPVDTAPPVISAAGWICASPTGRPAPQSRDPPFTCAVPPTQVGLRMDTSATRPAPPPWSGGAGFRN